MPELIGQRLGQYEILSLVGKGGMAKVYRARQISMDRDVALKVIKPDLAETGDFIKRFEREAKVIASLSHLHILKVFDYGEEENLVYLVTELLTGGSLAEAISSNSISIANLFRLLDQIASALDYAHQKGVVHRDLKPQNVLLDESGNAFLTDFGLAKFLHDSTSITKSGIAMGTPAYMAPEQWNGQLIDARTDVYALGIMVFEILTGQLPFSADTPYRMMHMHIYEPPPSVNKFRADLPSELDAVLASAIAKDREQRFVSASQFAAAVKAALSDFAQTASAQPAHSIAVRISAAADDPTLRKVQVSVAQPETPIADLDPTLRKNEVESEPLTKAPSRRNPRRLLAPLALLVIITLVAGLVLLKSTPAKNDVPAPTSIPNQSGFKATKAITAANAAQVKEKSVLNTSSALLNTAFSPDGALLAAGSDDNMIHLWNIATGAELPNLRGHTGAVTAIAYSPDGSILASGSADHTITLWDTKTITAKAVLKGPKDLISGLAFSPEGRVLAVRSSDLNLTFWDVMTNQQSPLVIKTTVAGGGIAISPDGLLVAYGDADNTLDVRSIKDGSIQYEIKGGRAPIANVAFSPKDELLAVSTTDGAVVLFDKKTQKARPPMFMSIGDGAAYPLAFSPDGTVLAGGSGKNTILLWEVATGKQLASLQGHKDQVVSLAFSGDGTLLASAGDHDNTIHVWGTP